MSDLFMCMSFVMPVPGHYVKPETHKGLKTPYEFLVKLKKETKKEGTEQISSIPFQKRIIDAYGPLLERNR